MYSSLLVNGDDNVAHYGNDDVNYDHNDDNDNGAEAQKPKTIRKIPDSLNLLGNLEIIWKIRTVLKSSEKLVIIQKNLDS